MDAGCGSQMFKTECSHLIYKSQDFGQYESDDKQMMNGKNKEISGETKPTYKYGDLDYVGDIWDVDEKNETFDSILCTEVFEHIPYPIEAVKEFPHFIQNLAYEYEGNPELGDLIAQKAQKYRHITSRVRSLYQL